MVSVVGFCAMAVAAALPAYGGTGFDARSRGGSSFLSASTVKVGASGQVYSWRPACCGNPGTWTTVVHGHTYTWRAGPEASTADIMRGMGLRRDMLVRDHTTHIARR
jgi:hypothetical protein